MLLLQLLFRDSESIDLRTKLTPKSRNTWNYSRVFGAKTEPQSIEGEL